MELRNLDMETTSGNSAIRDPLHGAGGYPLVILVGEDPEREADLIREVLRSNGLRAALWVAGDGEDAMACVRREGKYGGARRPDLIVLGMNIPKMSGLEVLTGLRNDPRLRRIPVVMWTANADESEVAQCYELGAHSYIVKREDGAEFEDELTSIFLYWLTIVELPPTE